MDTPALPGPLARALSALAAAFGPAGVEWLVAGSCARALAGWRVVPGDLDVEVAAADVPAAAAALGLAHRTEEDRRARSIRARGTVEGVDVDVTGGLVLIGAWGVLPPDFELLQRFASTVRVGDVPVLVAPVEEQIARVLVSGDDDRRARLVDEAPPGFVPDGDYVELRLGSARAAR